jgi:hypothetical protein
MKSFYLQSSLNIPLVVSKLCPGQESGRTDKAATICSYGFGAMSRTKFKVKKNKGQKITKGKAELRLFCTALLFNEIYLPTNFHVNISYSLRGMLID